MNASGSCVYAEDGLSFKSKLQSLFNAFMLFLDPLTRITQSDDTDVVFDELFGRVVTPPVPSVPQPQTSGACPTCTRRSRRR